MTDDFYDLLGVDRDASQEEIRKAFREQVREYHPDLNDDPRAPAQFTALKKAYDTLGDPKERDDYERMGHTSYVAKRINGLPSPDEWEIPERKNGNGTGADHGGDIAGDDASGTGEAASSSSASSTKDGGSGGRTNGANRERSAAGGSASGHREARSATATGSANANSTGGAASATAAGTSGTTRRTGNGASGTATEDVGTRFRKRVRWLRRVSLGWPLIILSDTLYVVGLIFYLSNNERALRTLLDKLATAVRGPGSVAAVLGTTHGVTPLSEYIVSDVTGGTTVGGPLLILGMAFIPSVYFFVIRETRQIRTPWQPSYLYVVGAMGPIVGLVANATVTTPGLYVDLACFFLLPLGSVLALPFSAFLRPKLRRAVRRTVRRYR